uniref:Uncharacterized protein n=1 Tax=Craspedostauros australis TaxID=1486917 RepID=A0A7R9WXI6_9STRA|mmetsp:Transcript_23513/g.65649  ORF Transcript_23513/g.65649 Transcript_23513/m.65649 type:complete len:123 (+) Transcript_23513:298-666(+)
MVVNLEDDLNIAITHNYVSTSNLGNVLQFLKTKQDQISGCRDREESIKPEHLHEQFVECLQRKYSENKLKRALQQDGWTCDAWHVESKKKARTDGKEQQPTSPKTSMAAQFQANSSFSFSFL